MKLIIAAALAAATVAGALAGAVAPASAQPYGGQPYGPPPPPPGYQNGGQPYGGQPYGPPPPQPGYQNGGPGYAAPGGWEIERRIDWIQQRIIHGRQDGSLNKHEARRAEGTLGSIQYEVQNDRRRAAYAD